MNRKALIFTSMTMTFASLLFLAEVRDTLNGAEVHQKSAKFWKEKVAREQLKKLIAMGQFADFKQDVALLLPEQIKIQKVEQEKQKLRDLASVIPHEGVHEITLGHSASAMLEKGKNLVRKRDYQPGIDELKHLIDKFPDSVHVVEAHYLIVEAFSQQDKNTAVIEWVDRMVELFPANRLTGYALLKAGNLYELDGRHQDAIKVYKIIVAVYDDKNLIEQAQKAVRGLQL